MSEYLRNKFLSDVQKEYNQSQSSLAQSVSSYNPILPTSISNESKTISLITLDILKFRKSCIFQLREMITNCKKINPYFCSVLEATNYLNSLQNNLKNWIESFSLLECDLNQLLEKLEYNCDVNENDISAITVEESISELGNCNTVQREAVSKDIYICDTPSTSSELSYIVHGNNSQRTMPISMEEDTIEIPKFMSEQNNNIFNNIDSESEISNNSLEYHHFKACFVKLKAADNAICHPYIVNMSKRSCLLLGSEEDFAQCDGRMESNRKIINVEVCQSDSSVFSLDNIVKDVKNCQKWINSDENYTFDETESEILRLSESTPNKSLPSESGLNEALVPSTCSNNNIGLSSSKAVDLTSTKGKQLYVHIPIKERELCDSFKRPKKRKIIYISSSESDNGSPILKRSILQY